MLVLTVTISIVVVMVTLPRSYGQGHLIFASGCDGTGRELPNEDWVPSAVQGPSCHSVTWQVQG